MRPIVTAGHTEVQRTIGRSTAGSQSTVGKGRGITKEIGFKTVLKVPGHSGARVVVEIPISKEIKLG